MATIINYHKLSGLRQHKLSCSLEGQKSSDVSLIGLNMEVSAGHHTFLEALSGNPFPCLFQVLELPSLLCWWPLPPSMKPAVAMLSSCHAAISLDTLLPLSSTFQDPCDYTGSNWIIQDDLPMLISANYYVLLCLQP